MCRRTATLRARPREIPQERLRRRKLIGESFPRNEMRRHAMNSNRALFAIALAAVVAPLTTLAVRAQTPRVDPAAVQTLKRMTDYISRLQKFSVHTESTLEYWSDRGQRIDHDVAANLTLRRPNKIHAKRVASWSNRSSITTARPSRFIYLPKESTQRSRRRERSRNSSTTRARNSVSSSRSRISCTATP